MLSVFQTHADWTTYSRKVQTSRQQASSRGKSQLHTVDCEITVANTRIHNASIYLTFRYISEFRHTVTHGLITLYLQNLQKLLSAKNLAL